MRERNFVVRTRYVCSFDFWWWFFLSLNIASFYDVIITPGVKKVKIELEEISSEGEATRS